MKERTTLELKWYMFNYKRNIFELQIMMNKKSSTLFMKCGQTLSLFISFHGDLEAK